MGLQAEGAEERFIDPARGAEAVVLAETDDRCASARTCITVHAASIIAALFQSALHCGNIVIHDVSGAPAIPPAVIWRRRWRWRNEHAHSGPPGTALTLNPDTGAALTLNPDAGAALTLNADTGTLRACPPGRGGRLSPHIAGRILGCGCRLRGSLALFVMLARVARSALRGLLLVIFVRFRKGRRCDAHRCDDGCDEGAVE